MAHARPSSALPYFLDRESRPATLLQEEKKEHALAAVAGDPARYKLNHVMVGSHGLSQLSDVFQRYHYGIRYAKLLSVCFEERRSDLAEFAAIAHQNAIRPYVGGGVTEDAMQNGSLYSLTTTLHRAGIDTIEVSNSSGDLPACRVAKDIAALRRDFAHVIVEIGGKGTDEYRTLGQWTDDLEAALALNPETIILEGTGSGRSGIYSGSLAPRSLVASALLERAGKRRDRLLFEAPNQDQRVYWVNEFLGWNAQLGNIWPESLALQNMDTIRTTAMRPESIEGIATRASAQRLVWQEVRQACQEVGADPDMVVFSGSMDGFTADMLSASPEWRQSLRVSIRRMMRAPFARRAPVTIDFTELILALRWGKQE